MVIGAMDKNNPKMEEKIQLLMDRSENNSGLGDIQQVGSTFWGEEQQVQML